MRKIPKICLHKYQQTIIFDLAYMSVRTGKSKICRVDQSRLETLRQELILEADFLLPLGNPGFALKAFY